MWGHHRGGGLSLIHVYLIAEATAHRATGDSTSCPCCKALITRSIRLEASPESG